MRTSFNRRRFIATGVFAFAARHGYDSLFAAPIRGRAKRCIVLWMNGGPSQFETLDPKPGVANGGPTTAIETAAGDLRISSHLPQVAKQAKHLTVLRNVTSPEGDHQRGQYLLHTGFRLVPSFPRPTLGSIVSERTDPAPFPKFVSFGSRGHGPAFLGPQHAPWTLGEPNEAFELLQSLRKQQGRLRLLKQLGREFRDSRDQEAVRDRHAALANIEQMVNTPFVGALNEQASPAKDRDRYGEHLFGRQCLAARRLLEAGVRFVEVQLDGWDTHANNFPATTRLCRQLDRPWAALLEDLDQRGMLDETLVLWMGEFGRTPRINSQNGRDHFPTVTPVAMAGGGVPQGRVIGATNPNGTTIDGDSLSVADVFATILDKLGIAPDHQFTTAFGSPTSATDDGTVIF